MMKMALQFFAFVVASISIVYASLWNECPLPEEMTSCSCKWLLAPVISCNQIKSQKDLQSNLQGLKGYGVHQLTLSGIRTSSVTDDLFKDLYVKQLVLDNWQVINGPVSLGSTPFLGLEKSLEELEIKNSFNTDSMLLDMKLSHLEKMKIASFQDNNIPTIGNECFANGPKTLQMLLLERCEIKELGDKVFHSLENLMFMTVVGNHFNHVSRSMFPSPASHLRKMDLHLFREHEKEFLIKLISEFKSTYKFTRKEPKFYVIKGLRLNSIRYNKISILPNDMFSEMPLLSEVNFSDNNIHLLDERTWSDTLMCLARLYFDGNPLQCDDSLKWVCSNRADIVVAKCVSPTAKNGLTVRQFCKK